MKVELSNNSKIAVLIPCYNEEKTIAKVVSDYKKALPQADIYVFDNNSSDRTVEIAKEHGAIVCTEPRQGKGNVVRTMFRVIDADCYVTTNYCEQNLPKNTDLGFFTVDRLFFSSKFATLP